MKIRYKCPFAAIFLILTFAVSACLNVSGERSGSFEAVLRWNGAPARIVFSNTLLLQKLTEGITINVASHIFKHDLRRYIAKIDFGKLDGINENSPSFEMHKWVLDNISFDMSKSGVIERTEAILHSRRAVCLGKSQVLLSIMLTTGRNARMVVGFHNVTVGHAWVQEYDEEENLIGFWDPTLGITEEFSAEQYKKIVENGLVVLADYRPLFSFNKTKMWIHGK